MSDFSDFNSGNQVGNFLSGSGFSRGSNWHSSLRYPSPYLDLASQYLPRTQKELYHICRYFYLTSPVINPIVRKLAGYPLTPMYVDTSDFEKKIFWEDYMNGPLNLPEYLNSFGIDYNVYGNAFGYIHFPIIKTLTCPNCKKEDKIENCKYSFRNLNYDLTCPRCGMNNREAIVRDFPKKSMNEITLNRLPPELIDIEQCPLTGYKDYFLTIPRVTRNEIMIGKKVLVERLPDVFIDSLRKNKRLKLTPGKFFHFQRPSVSHLDWLGYGEPLMFPVLKDKYYFQILRKAQEAIMHSAIVPLRFVFPQSGDAQTSPYTNVNLLRWMNNMRSEFVKWRRDPNHVGFVPIPVGSQIVGAEGKALLLFQELELQSNLICNGMGVPLEFYKGGLSWSGSNMSLRMLQNDFISYRNKLKVFVEDFILGNIADYLGKNRPKIAFTKFKMADDLQRSALEFQMYQSQLLSGEVVVQGMDHDFFTEKEKINKEQHDLISIQKKNQIAQANIAGEAQMIQAKWMAQAQKKQQMMSVQPQAASQQKQQGQQEDPMAAMASGAGQENAQIDVNTLAQTANNELSKLNDFDRQSAMNQIKMSAPDVFQAMQQLNMQNQGAIESSLDPMNSPEIKPPRSPNPAM